MRRRKQSRTVLRQVPPLAAAVSRPEAATVAARHKIPKAAREIGDGRDGSRQRPTKEAATAKPPLAVAHPPSKHKKGR